MKNTIKFTTSANFGFATVLADTNSLDCLVDEATQTVWTNDAAGFAAAFDAGGIDIEEYVVAEGDPAEYAALAKKLVAVAEAEADAEDEAAE